MKYVSLEAHTHTTHTKKRERQQFRSTKVKEERNRRREYMIGLRPHIIGRLDLPSHFFDYAVKTFC